MRIHDDGRLEARYTWDPAAYPAGAYFGPELSFTCPAHAPLDVRYDPTPTAVWEYPIETVSKSEQGLDRTVQGYAVTPLWPASLGHAHVTLTPVPAAPASDQPCPRSSSPPPLLSESASRMVEAAGACPASGWA